MPDDSCKARAEERGDKTFTLVGQDRTSPEVICYWILRNIETAPAGKLVDALARALAMRALSGRKSAD